jgi:hypothetical protein
MSKDEISALKMRMQQKKQPWTDSGAPTKAEIRSTFPAMTAKLIAKPVEKPAIIVAAKPMIPTAAGLPPLKLAPATVDIYLELQSRPQQGGLGAVFPMNTRKKDGAREIWVTLFRERPVVEQALAAT